MVCHLEQSTDALPLMLVQVAAVSLASSFLLLLIQMLKRKLVSFLKGTYDQAQVGLVVIDTS